MAGFWVGLALDDRGGRQPLPLLRYDRGAGAGWFAGFAVGGEADGAHEPCFATVFDQSTAVGVGHLFRVPCGLNRAWAMWFDLGNFDATGKQLALGFYRASQEADRTDRAKADRDMLVDNITFDSKLIKAAGPINKTGVQPVNVLVYYPNGGSVCTNGNSAYGTYATPDTAVVKVVATASDGTTVTDTAPYSNGLGFWASSLSNLAAGKTYTLVASGTSTDSNQTAPFTARTCP